MPGMLQRGDFRGDVDRHLALHVDEGLVFRELGAQLLVRHAEQLAERGQLVAPRSSGTDSGIAQIARTGRLVASTRPLRSRILPRVAGSSSRR
jgi:hypothetical protein